MYRKLTIHLVLMSLVFISGLFSSQPVWGWSFEESCNRTVESRATHLRLDNTYFPFSGQQYLTMVSAMQEYNTDILGSGWRFTYESDYNGVGSWNGSNEVSFKSLPDNSGYTYWWYHYDLLLTWDETCVYREYIEEADIYFNSDESWTPTYLKAVALHELGHAAGLRHENRVVATMGAGSDAYFGLNRDLPLIHADDKAGMRSVYGDGTKGTDVAVHAFKQISTAGEYGIIWNVNQSTLLTDPTMPYAELEYTLENHGTYTEDVAVSFYIFNNNAWQFLGSTDIFGIPSGYVGTMTRFLYIPSVSAGPYRFKVRVDPYSRVDTNPWNDEFEYPNTIYINFDFANIADALETPWQTGEHGTLYTNVFGRSSFNVVTGYHFTPLVNGKIFQLGGFFNGTRWINLFNQATKELLAEASVTSSNSWSYTPIVPVEVTAGTTYTVVANYNSSNYSYRDSVTLPQNFGSIRITGSTWDVSAYSTFCPTRTITTTMYGQVDIGFMANNYPPVLKSIGSKTVSEGLTLSFSISATDQNGTPLTYTASPLPPGAIFDPASRTFSWTPDYTQAGKYYVTFTVTDGTLLDSETIAINVFNVNRAPTLSPIGNKTVVEGALLTFDISVIDPDAEALATTVTNLPSGAAFNGKTFSWTPGYTQSGTYNVTFTVTDPGGLDDSETIAIDVGVANDLILSNQTINSGVVQYRAQNSITAGPAFVVDVGADVTFKAGTVIKLEPGFSAKTGSKFRAVPSLN